MSTPPHPKVRQCTHIKVNGVRCGSPAMKNQFFCFFHTDLIRGISRRVDAEIGTLALLENADAIQVSLMYVMQEVRDQSIDYKRASLLIKLLHLAFRNVKNLTFEKASTRRNAVIEPPNYAAQTLVDHPEYGAPSRPIQHDELFPDGKETQIKFAYSRAASNNAPATPVQAAPLETKPVTASASPRAAEVEPAEKPALLSLQATTDTKPAPVTKKLCKPGDHAAIPARKSPLTRLRTSVTKRDVDPDVVEVQRSVAALPKVIPRQPGQSSTDYAKASRRHNRKLRELRRVATASPRAFRGDWRALKTLFEFAGIFPAKSGGPRSAPAVGANVGSHSKHPPPRRGLREPPRLYQLRSCGD